MEKTFEIKRRCTLTHLLDYTNNNEPARFTKGLLRDIHCEIIARKSIQRQKNQNRKDHALVLLDIEYKCIGYHFFDATVQEEDLEYFRKGLLGNSSTAEIAEHVIASKAHHALIIYGNRAKNSHIYPSNPIHEDRGFISRVIKLMDLLYVNFIECRSVQLNHTYATRKG